MKAVNYNIAAYVVYLTLMVGIIVYIGRLCYRNGRVFILGVMNGKEELTDHLNNILLIAYYLFNIGYAFMTLRTWTRVLDFEMLLSSISTNMGVLVLILAVTHYFNIFLIGYLSKKQALKQ